MYYLLHLHKKESSNFRGRWTRTTMIRPHMPRTEEPGGGGEVPHRWLAAVGLEGLFWSSFGRTKNSVRHADGLLMREALDCFARDGWLGCRRGQGQGAEQGRGTGGAKQGGRPRRFGGLSLSTASTWMPPVQILVVEERRGGEVAGGGREAWRGGAGAGRRGGGAPATRRGGGRRGREPAEEDRWWRRRDPVIWGRNTATGSGGWGHDRDGWIRRLVRGAAAAVGERR